MHDLWKYLNKEESTHFWLPRSSKHVILNASNLHILMVLYKTFSWLASDNIARLLNVSILLCWRKIFYLRFMYRTELRLKSGSFDPDRFNLKKHARFFKLMKISHPSFSPSKNVKNIKKDWISVKIGSVSFLHLILITL